MNHYFWVWNNFILYEFLFEKSLWEVRKNLNVDSTFKRSEVISINKEGAP